MAVFSLERTAPLPLDEAWRRLTAWQRHGDSVPLTRVTVATPGPTRPGTAIVARTGLGPLAFDDTMEVTVWEPPEDDSPAAAGWRSAAGWSAAGRRSRCGRGPAAAPGSCGARS